MLLDLLLEARRYLVPGPLEDRTSITSGSMLARPTCTPAWSALRLEDVTRDRGRRDPQIGDVDAGRGEAGDDRALDHAARIGGVAAGDDAIAAAERRAERRRQPHRGLGREVDVDEAGCALATERRARRPRLPHDALVDLGAGLDLLERVDPDTGEDARLWPDRDLVADRDALVDADMVTHVAAAADDRSLDDRAPAEVRPRVDHAPRDARRLPAR